MAAHNVIDKIERAMASGDVLDIALGDIEATSLDVNKIVPSTGTDVEIEATTITLDGAVSVSGAIDGAARIRSSSPSAGIGYTTGAGGTVAQLTDRTTGVTINKLSGTITTHNASLAAETAAEFTVTNDTIGIGYAIILSQRSGSNGGNTKVTVSAVAASSFKIKVANDNAAGGTAETGAIIINFVAITGVTV